MTQPTKLSFLPGVPSEYALERLKLAGGNEVGSGKFNSPESSAALAVNTFGWFHKRPDRLPPFAMLSVSSAEIVEVEYCARFPWAGGRHPWLDAWIETSEAIIGIESKRFEPFRDEKTVELSDAYDRPVWGDQMRPFESMRDSLRSGVTRFQFLDAAQLVKHSFGLVTEGRKTGKRPYLVYLFAEPAKFGGDVKKRHREEIARFAAAVDGAEVGFAAISYREWMNSWPDSNLELIAHRRAILDRFDP
jgi:hypothetical protein